MHYPGYNYLGPGSDTNSGKKPTNSLDRAAYKHDISYGNIIKKSKRNPYFNSNYADDIFIKDTDKDKSLPGYLSNSFFRGKRTLSRLLGQSYIDNEDLRPNKKRKTTTTTTMKRMLPFRNKRHTKRFKRRRRGRSTNMFRKVMSIINPVKKFQNQHFMRFTGTINRRNYAMLGPIIINASSPGYYPNSFTPTTDALTYALGGSNLATAGNWDKSAEYYVKCNYNWKISNNSNVTMKGTIYWLKYKIDSNSRPLDVIADPDYYDNAVFYPNNATIDAITQDTTTSSSHNYNSPLHYNILTDKLLKKVFSRKWTIAKGRSMVFRPGQTITVGYKHKFRRYGFSDLFDNTTASAVYPRGTVFPILVYDGDILPGTKTPNDLIGPYTVLQSGVNCGDWSYIMSSYFTVQTKFSVAQRTYLTEQASAALREDTAADLKVLGIDNNAAASAI